VAGEVLVAAEEADAGAAEAEVSRVVNSTRAKVPATSTNSDAESRHRCKIYNRCLLVQQALPGRQTV
jgi:hypothetical protein